MNEMHCNNSVVTAEKSEVMEDSGDVCLTFLIVFFIKM